MYRAHTSTEPKMGLVHYWYTYLTPQSMPVTFFPFRHYSTITCSGIPLLVLQSFGAHAIMDVPDLPPNVPELPPLPLPDEHNANNNAIPFLVCQYIFEGVQDLPQELRSHVTMFYEELITLMEGTSESWQLIIKEKYMTILTAMIHLHNGEPIKLLRSIYT
jgi:hypothetical protein